MTCRMSRRAVGPLLLTVALGPLVASCQGGSVGEGGVPGAEVPEDAGSAGGAYVPVEARARSAELPDTFGPGRPPTDEEIRERDIDVRPDGIGLPPGSGTATLGATVFRDNCAACHGQDGEGAASDRLVGTEPMRPDGYPRTIGNYWPYATTLYDYIRRTMPFDRPGSLESDEIYGLVAWLLHRNGIIPEGLVMDASTLPLVEMPARDRFVPDDRMDYDVVR